MKLLHLLALAASFFVFACSSAEGPLDEDVGSVEQPIPACGYPQYFHAFSTIANIATSPNDPVNCPAVYYPEEPRAWTIDPNSVAPPRRADNRCSCYWGGPGICRNHLTGQWGQDQCYLGSCFVYRNFTCGYGPGCSYLIHYEMNPAFTYTGSWNKAQLTLRATEPGCQRVMTINNFNTVVQGIPL